MDLHVDDILQDKVSGEYWRVHALLDNEKGVPIAVIRHWCRPQRSLAVATIPDYFVRKEPVLTRCP